MINISTYLGTMVGTTLHPTDWIDEVDAISRTKMYGYLYTSGCKESAQTHIFIKRYKSLLYTTSNWHCKNDKLWHRISADAPKLGAQYIQDDHLRDSLA